MFLRFKWYHLLLRRYKNFLKPGQTSHSSTLFENDLEFVVYWPKNKDKLFHGHDSGIEKKQQINREFLSMSDKFDCPFTI